MIIKLCILNNYSFIVSIITSILTICFQNKIPYQTCFTAVYYCTTIAKLRNDLKKSKMNLKVHNTMLH